jgi:hypothetical protein
LLGNPEPLLATGHLNYLEVDPQPSVAVELPTSPKRRVDLLSNGMPTMVAFLGLVEESNLTAEHWGWTASTGRSRMRTMMILRVPEARIAHLQEVDPRKLLALLDKPHALLLDLKKVVGDCQRIRDQTDDPDLQHDLMMQVIEVEQTPDEWDYEAIDLVSEREDEIAKVLDAMDVYLSGTE